MLNSFILIIICHERDIVYCNFRVGMVFVVDDCTPNSKPKPECCVLECPAFEIRHFGPHMFTSRASLILTK